MLFAIVAFGLSNLGTAAMDWLKQLSITPTQSAAFSTGIGLAVVFLTVLLEGLKEPAAATAAPAPAGNVYTGRAVGSYPPPYQQTYQQPYPPVQPIQPGRKPPKSQRRVSWAVVLVLVVGLLGVGGFAVTWGVQWANGQAICLLDPKHYEGTQRLGGPAAATSGTLGIEITQVMVSKCGTVITVHAVNAGDVPLELPVFGNTSLTVPGRTSLGGDPRTSDWNQTVPAGGEMIGVLVFKQVPANTPLVTLSFNTVFGRLQGPRGISVQIPLSPVPAS